MIDNFTYRLGVESDVVPVCRLADKFESELGWVRKNSILEAVEKRELIVCYKEEEIVGFCYFHKRRDSWVTVYSIVTKKEFQRFGIGRELFNMTPRPIRLKVTTDNHKANSFYEKFEGEIVRVEVGRNRELNVWEFKN